MSCASPEVEPPTADPAADLATLSRVDELFGQRADIEKLRQAVELAARIRNPERRVFESEWKFAKYSYFLGKRSLDKEESTAALEKGRDAGKIAMRLEPGKPDGYFWYAANLGELSRRSPITIGLRSVDDIKTAMHRVIELDPAYQRASAFDALGQVELATRLSDGSAEKAAEYLEKGVVIAGDNVNTRLHLAETYFALGRDREALDQLDVLFKTKPDPDYEIEHAATVEQGRELLKRHQ